jgi:tetratricopeptide (TPR) repeat protein
MRRILRLSVSVAYKNRTSLSCVYHQLMNSTSTVSIIHRQQQRYRTYKPVSPSSPSTQSEQDQQQEDHFRTLVKQADELLKSKRYAQAVDGYLVAIDTLNYEMRGPENDKEAIIFVKYRYYVLDSLRECYDALGEYNKAIRQCDEFFKLEKELTKLRILDQWEESLNFLAAKKVEYLITLKRLNEALTELNTLIDRRLLPMQKMDQKNDKIKKQLVYALTQRGKIYAQKVEYLPALHSLDLALNIIPNYTEALSIKCLCLLRTGRSNEAEEIARRIVERSIVSTSDYRCRVLYSEILLKTGKPLECIKLCDTTLQLYPDDFIPLLYRAQAHMELYQYQQTLDDLQRYESVHGIHPSSLDQVDSTSEFIVRALHSLCKFKQAEEQIEQRLKKLDTNEKSADEMKRNLIGLKAITKYHLAKYSEAHDLFCYSVYPVLFSTYVKERPHFALDLLCTYSQTLAAVDDHNLSVLILQGAYDKLISRLNIENMDDALSLDLYYATLAEVTARKGNYKEARSILAEGNSKLKDKYDQPLIHSRIADGMIYYYEKEYQKAYDALYPLLVILPTDPRARSYKDIKVVVTKCKQQLEQSQ